MEKDYNIIYILRGYVCHANAPEF